MEGLKEGKEMLGDKLVGCNLVRGCLRRVWVIVRRVSKHAYIILCITSDKRVCVKLKASLLLVWDWTAKHVELYRHVTSLFHMVID
ncbi:hypothetical protein alecur_101 [Candidatus Hodgkinia cicadicola]|uniref:Uncharacterized protein n=1 Tax=Candidatus Hodgkinia cicadicola TaxID=573658 RepID=A0ABX4MHQ5_9HYPH|nr:hypothetical protein alecur_101 [Candidatus Hodgkinia cicadicola]